MVGSRPCRQKQQGSNGRPHEATLACQKLRELGNCPTSQVGACARNHTLFTHPCTTTFEAWLVVDPADENSKGRMEDHTRPLLHAKNLENWGTAQHLKWEHAHGNHTLFTHPCTTTFEAWLVVDPADRNSKGRMEDHTRPLLHAKNLENWGTAQHLKWEHAHKNHTLFTHPCTTTFEAWLVVDPADENSKGRMEDHTRPLLHAKNLENWGTAQHLKWEHAHKNHTLFTHPCTTTFEAWLVVDPADENSKGRMEDHTRPLLHAKNLENWGTAQHLKWEHAHGNHTLFTHPCTTTFEAWLVVDSADRNSKGRMEDHTRPLLHAKNLENWGTAQHLKWEHA